MRVLKACFPLLYFLISFNSSAQNLIPNGSFEELKVNINNGSLTPDKLEGGWNSFTSIYTKDNKPLVIICDKCPNTVPEGKADIRYSNLNISNGKENVVAVLQVPLNKELKKDSAYKFSLIYSLAFVEKCPDDSLVNPKSLQFYLSDTCIDKLADIKNLDKNKLINIIIEKIKMNSSGGRKTPEFYIKASGGEKYLLLGTFSSKYLKNYFIILVLDNVKLEPISQLTYNLKTTNIDSSFIFENILFEFDKAVLKRSSLVLLKQLVVELNNNPIMKLQISGHTDNIGTSEHNQNLSEQRAKAVVDYLVKNGIAANRLTFKGYGSSKPAADNQTDQGKEKNRRVEIMVVDK